MDKYFIPYDQTLTLIELGFDEPCIGYYDLDKYCFTIREQDDVDGDWTIAPLYQQAFRWFREKHNIKFYIIEDNWNEWCTIEILNTGVDKEYEEIGDYKSYEEAELECLKKLIEIVKNK